MFTFLLNKKRKMITLLWRREALVPVVHDIPDFIMKIGVMIYKFEFAVLFNSIKILCNI